MGAWGCLRVILNRKNWIDFVFQPFYRIIIKVYVGGPYWLVFY